MNSYQTLNSKLNIDEPLKAIKVIDFLFFLGLIDITAAGYYLICLLLLSDPLQVLKSLLMNWRVESGVLDEGDSAGVPQESFENHFRDMFLNVMHI